MVKKKKMKLNMASIPKQYFGKWVALSVGTNKVITSGTNPKEVYEKSKGKPDIVITKVPVKNYSYLL